MGAPSIYPSALISLLHAAEGIIVGSTSTENTPRRKKNARAKIAAADKKMAILAINRGPFDLFDDFAEAFIGGLLTDKNSL